MHDNELPISDDLVRQLIDEQLPQWVDLPLNRINSSGTVHAMYRLGSDLVVRLPRLVEYAAALERETQVLPQLAPLLPLTIPKVEAVGQPTDTYPSLWSVLTWIEGEPVDSGPTYDQERAAQRLGEFVVSMRSVTEPGPPSASQRAEPIAHIDAWVRTSIDAISSEFDSAMLHTAWESSLAATAWDGIGKWIHADLMPGNLVVDAGELAAIIDFGTCGIGNPTYDLIAGWWVFDEPARQTFRQASRADDATWIRARGLALGLAAGALAYYVDSNPAFADLARTTITRVLHDQG